MITADKNAEVIADDLKISDGAERDIVGDLRIFANVDGNAVESLNENVVKSLRISECVVGSVVKSAAKNAIKGAVTDAGRDADS